MIDNVLIVENLTKIYRLGTINHGTLRQDLVSWWARFRGKEDPNSPITVEGGTRSLNSSVDRFLALNNVSFAVSQGEIVGIIGRNGAGKSTLLKILSRITAPTSGEVRLKGRVASLLEVGTGFHPELTGRENIYLNGAIIGMRKSEIRRKLDEIIDFAEVEKFIDTPVKRYSSGMYVRLAFGVAAHLEPDILVVDEVLAVGDAQFQKKCLGKMESVSRSGRTVLLVSHNMTLVQNLCDRCLLLKNGAVELCGETREVIEYYSNVLDGHRSGCYADLSSHPGRSPGMNPIIRAIALCKRDELGKYRDVVTTGEDVEFEIHYDCGAMRLNYAFIGICTAMGERLVSVGTHLDPGFDAAISGAGVLRCRVNNLTLAEGNYSVLVALGNRPGETIDCVNDALRFQVELGNYFENGASLLPKQGFFAVKSRWQVV
jgi:lipopolysaccharide transport system ATP-binding protein